MELLKKLFSNNNTPVTEALNKGALIVDVRTPEEFKNGHVTGSVNYPLQQFGNTYKKLPTDKPIVLCCRSGMRSGQATAFLKDLGYTNAINGGPYTSVEQLLKNK